MNRRTPSRLDIAGVALPDGGDTPDSSETSSDGGQRDGPSTDGDDPAGEQVVPSPDVFERITDAFFALDADYRFTYLNSRAAEILGVDAEAAVGSHISKHVPEAVGTTFFEEPHRAMREQEPVTFEEYFPPLDSWFEVRVYPSETGLSVYFRDVTERHESRERLEETTETLTAILDTSPIGIVVFSTDRTIRWLNDRAAEILKMNREEAAAAIQQPLSVDTVDENGDPIERPALPSSRVLATGEPVFGQVLGVDRNGQRYWISVNAAPLRDDDGEIDRIVATFEDVTERREREAELARQNARLNEFASVVSHDLRNPLGVAKGYLDIAREEGDPEAFDRAADALDRIEDIVDALLVLARQGDTVGGTEPVDLAAVVADAWATSETDDADLVVDTDATVDADPERLRTLLENLFRNAVEHGDDGVTVTVGDLAAGGFFVADDGPGVPEAEREQVFERGYSGGDGTGFGLAIVREVAEAHGWEVAVTESEAGGARFEIRF